MAMVIQLHEGVAIHKFKLDKPLLRIGRDPGCDIFLDNTVVSAEHAVIKIEDNALVFGYRRGGLFLRRRFASRRRQRFPFLHTFCRGSAIPDP